MVKLTKVPHVSPEQSNAIESLEFPASFYVGPETPAILETTLRGEPLTSGSTPFNIYLQNVFDQQRQVKRVHDEVLANPPKWMKKSVADSVGHFYESRTPHRIERNFESFENRLHYHFSEVPEFMRDTVARSITGHGSPTENLVTADLLKMPTVELGSAMIVYGERMENIPLIRMGYREAVDILGGRLVKSAPNYQIKRFDISEDPEGCQVVHMTRTFTVAEIQDYTVFERSSFTLDLEHLEPALTAWLKSMPKQGPYWELDITGNGKFRNTITDAFTRDLKDVVIPVSFTSWAVNRSLEMRTLKDDDYKRNTARHMMRSARVNSGAAYNEDDEMLVRPPAGYELLGLSERFKEEQSNY